MQSIFAIIVANGVIISMQGYAITKALSQLIIQIVLKPSVKPIFVKVKKPEITNDIKSAIINENTNLKYLAGNMNTFFTGDYNIKFRFTLV